MLLKDDVTEVITSIQSVSTCNYNSTIEILLVDAPLLEFKLSIIYELEYVPLTNCGVYVAKVTPDCIQLTVTLTVVSTEEGS